MTFPEVDTLSTYGGFVSNHLDQVITDPTTDRDESVNEFYGSVAALTHTQIKSVYSFQYTSYSNISVRRTISDSCWTDKISGRAILSRTSTGVFNLQWNGTVVDILENDVSPGFRWGFVEKSAGYYKTWNSSTRYAVNDLVLSLDPSSNPRIFRCITAGTSDVSEPSWNLTIGNSTTDNTVTWKAIRFYPNPKLELTCSVSANSVTIYCFDETFTLVDPIGSLITVFLL